MSSFPSCRGEASKLIALALAGILLSPGVGRTESISLERTYAPIATLRAENRRELNTWLSQNTHPLGGSISDLDALASRLSNARVVGIGEATHGTHEDMALKATIIERLIENHDFNVLALEANRATGERLQQFVAPGSSETDVAAALRQSRIFAIYRCEALGNLLLQMQKWNKSAMKPVRVVGIDVQDPGRDAKAALAALETHDPTEARRLRIALAELTVERIPNVSALFNEATRSTWERWSAAAKALDGALHRDAALPFDAAEASYALQQALATYEFDVGGEKDNSELPPEAFARRDAAMAKRLLRIEGLGNRVVLWAHNAHVADNSYDLLGAGVATTGRLLREQLGSSGYQSVNFTYRHATFHAQRGDAKGNPIRTGSMPQFSISAAPDWLSTIIARGRKQPFWLDLSTVPRFSRWGLWFRAEPFRRGGFGSIVTPQREREEDGPAPLGYGVDVLIFIDTLTPSRLYPPPFSN